MVHEHSIAFCAPSQLRMHMVADGDTVHIAVLNPYNQPIGNLRHLQIPTADLLAFLTGKTEEATAQNAEATCKFVRGTDMDHRTLAVRCEEPAKWFKLDDFIIIDEFKELLEAAPSTVSGPEVI